MMPTEEVPLSLTAADAASGQAAPGVESLGAATEAGLAQAAAEAVLQASREVRLVTRGDILTTLAASGILASVAGAPAQEKSREKDQDGPGGFADERKDSSGDEARESTASSHDGGVRPPLNDNTQDRVLLGENEDIPLPMVGSRDVPLPKDGNMDSWLTVVLSNHPGIASFESVTGQTVYHAPDLLSRTYALILDRKGAPATLMAEEIRANCRDYPRPVPLELFEAPPFGLSPEEIEAALKTMAASQKCKDITFTTASTGAVYLFSTLHMEREYATYLAERAETLAMNP